MENWGVMENNSWIVAKIREQRIRPNRPKAYVKWKNWKKQRYKRTLTSLTYMIRFIMEFNFFFVFFFSTFIFFCTLSSSTQPDLILNVHFVPDRFANLIQKILNVSLGKIRITRVNLQKSSISIFEIVLTQFCSYD